MEKMAEAESSIIYTSFDIRIEDFSTTSKEVSMRHVECHRHSIITFSASVFPNGVDEDTKGWLVVLSDEDVNNGGMNIKPFDSWWIVSIIDIEGNSRFPRYFEKYPPDIKDVKHDFTGKKYLENSFILNKADEFLSGGMLLLRCEIYFDLDIIKECMFVDGKAVLSDSFAMFLSSIPQAVCFKNGAQTGDSSDTFTVFDLTFKILTLPEFHESRKRFGVYGFPPALSSVNSEFKEESKDIFEHVWIFDTHPDRFLLSLARLPGNVGHLLVVFSPVIRRCINAPMKEQREKRIAFSNVDSLTFKIVLYFLESKNLPNYGFRKIMEVYKFSHLYEIENLQQICAERMVEISKVESQLEDMDRIAHLYSDEYLLTLLELRCREFGNSDRLRIENRLNSDCYV